MPTSNELSASFKAKRDDTWSNELRTRIHRAISWLESAEKYKEDDDICLLALCVSLHACYLRKEEDTAPTRASLKWKKFLENMKGTREIKKIQSIIFSDGATFFKTVTLNKYLHPATYKYDTWEAARIMSERQSLLQEYIKDRQADKILDEILYTINSIRNVLSHGSRTYDSQFNEEGIREAKKLTFKIVPFMIQVMIENPDKDWGGLAIPVLGED